MLIWKSETQQARRRVYFHLVDATDGKTPEDGEGSGSPEISKNGASFVTATNDLVLVSDGLYYLDLTTAEVDTFGALAYRYKSVNTAEFQNVAQIVALDPFDAAHLGLSFLAPLGDALTVPTSVLGPAPTFEEVMGWLVLMIRNSVVVDDNWVKIHNDSGTEIAKFAISDDGSIFTRGKAQSP